VSEQQRAYTGDKLLETEWLGQVVIGSSLQPCDAVLHLLLCCEHEDGDVGGGLALAEAAADLDTIHAWQQHVEYDEVGAQALGQSEAAHAVGGVLDTEALIAHAEANEIHDALLVVHDQEHGPCIIARTGHLLAVQAATWHCVLFHRSPAWSGEQIISALP